MIVYYEELEYKKQSSGIFSEKKQLSCTHREFQEERSGQAKNSKIFGGG